MLYVNGVLVNTNNKKEENEFFEIVRDYHKTVRDLQDYYGDYLVVETKVRPRQDPKTGVPRLTPPRGLLLRSNVNFKNDEDGSTSTIELLYSPTLLKEKDGQLIHENPNMLVTHGSATVDIKKNPDLAYYVVKCGKVGRTPAEGKKFHIYDSDLINKESAARRKLEGSVLNLIYSSLPEEKLRTLAKSFGVGDVNRKTSETVREELFDILQSAENTLKVRPDASVRGFKAFVESSEIRFHDQITALCRDAEEAGKLVYQANERRWVIDYSDGGQPYVLKEMSGNEYGDPIGSLVSFLITETNMLRKVENVMGIGSAPEKEPEKAVKPSSVEITTDQVLNENRVPVLKGWLRKIDPTVKIEKSAKGEDIKSLLLPLLHQESVQEAER